MSEPVGVYGRVGYLEARGKGWSHGRAKREALKRLRGLVDAEVARAGGGAVVEWVEMPHVGPVVSTAITALATLRIWKADGSQHKPPKKSGAGVGAEAGQSWSGPENSEKLG